MNLKFGAGLLAAFGLRALLVRAMLFALRRDAAKVNEGNYQPLLSRYADDAVLLFPGRPGEHRWAGEHRGKDAIERFLKDFTAAGLQGKVAELMVAGPPWAMTLMVRFDDRATGPDGAEIYHNRVVLLIRTRWGRIVRHDDFFEDTGRIAEFERKLTELGKLPAAA